MNGGEISVTENGEFDEPYVLAPGENRIVLEARDAYGHTKERIVEIVYLAPREAAEAPSAQSASSSPSGATPGATQAPELLPATTSIESSEHGTSSFAIPSGSASSTELVAPAQ